MTRELQTLTASTKCDSESDLQDQTPDTDDSGAHSYPEVSTVNNLGPGTGSFKRAPIMGNRGLEQRGKKTKTKDSPMVGNDLFKFKLYYLTQLDSIYETKQLIKMSLITT